MLFFFFHPMQETDLYIHNIRTYTFHEIQHPSTLPELRGRNSRNLNPKSAEVNKRLRGTVSRLSPMNPLKTVPWTSVDGPEDTTVSPTPTPALMTGQHGRKLQWALKSRPDLAHHARPRRETAVLPGEVSPAALLVQEKGIPIDYPDPLWPESTVTFSYQDFPQPAMVFLGTRYQVARSDSSTLQFLMYFSNVMFLC